MKMSFAIVLLYFVSGFAHVALVHAGLSSNASGWAQTAFIALLLYFMHRQICRAAGVLQNSGYREAMERASRSRLLWCLAIMLLHGAALTFGWPIKRVVWTGGAILVFTGYTIVQGCADVWRMRKMFWQMSVPCHPYIPQLPWASP